MKYLKCLCFVLLAVCLSVTPVRFQSLAEPQEAGEGYQPLSIDNAYYSLSVSEEDGRFTLTDKQTGACIHSYPDGVEDDRSMKNAGRLRVRSALVCHAVRQKHPGDRRSLQPHRLGQQRRHDGFQE